MARIKQPAAAGCLDSRDLVLAVYGPWHPEAECEASPTPLWSPRVSHERLQRLWALHRDRIEAEARRLGTATIWIVERIEFVAALNGHEPRR